MEINRQTVFYVYILRTSANTFYVGQTNNLGRRLKEHSHHNHFSKHYVQSFAGAKLLYFERYPTRWQAMKREFEIKRWSHAKKSALIYDDITQLDALK